MNKITEKNIYLEDNIQSLEFYDHIRKRPAMYLGQVNHKGFIDTLKKFITHFLKVSGSNTVKILFKEKFEGEITFTNIDKLMVSKVTSNSKFFTCSNICIIPLTN